MSTKLFSAAMLFFCCAAVGHAQTELHDFKTAPVPFEYKVSPLAPKSFTPSTIHPKLLKPIPFVTWNNQGTDTAKFSCQTDLGDVFTAPPDGMPILRSYPKTTDYEKKGSAILKSYPAEPFGKPSFIEPMPNPIKRVLIFEEKEKS